MTQRFPPFWRLVEMEKREDILVVDCGYLKEQAARERVDMLRAAGIGRENIQLGGFHRLLVRIPPRKAAQMLTRFPIVAGKTYYGSTHHWLGLSAQESAHAAP